VKKVSILLIATVFTLFITSCGGGKIKSNVSQMEKCLGSNKTTADLNKLSKNEASAIAKCMLEPMENLKNEGDKLSSDDQKKFENELRDALNKSEFKDILINLNYDKIKRLASLVPEIHLHRAQIQIQHLLRLQHLQMQTPLIAISLLPIMKNL